MIKLLRRIAFFPEKQILIGGQKFPSIIYNSSRAILRMSDKWPVLEKRRNEEEDDTNTKKGKVKKKMYALILAYCGQGYLGLQRNTGYNTIEEELMKALYTLEILNDDEFKRQQLVNFQRAARTDKNVSALRQCVNLNMRDGVTAEEINQHLPEEIRVLAVKRVTKGFNSKNSCCARTYSYTCPTFAFAHKSLKASEDYRIDDETFAKLNRMTQDYVGSHNFYNFTSGRKPFDPACRRLILNAEWQKPVVSDELEFITFLVKGQSFMLHQIRKMVGTLMAMCRGHLHENFIKKAHNPNEVLHLATAPGIGLLLEKVHYDWYNKKFGNNGIHDKLDFLDVELAVEEFRKKHIYPVLIKAEKEEKSMMEYLEVLDSHYEEYHNEETENEVPAEDGRARIEQATDAEKISQDTKIESIKNVDHSEDQSSSMETK